MKANGQVRWITIGTVSQRYIFDRGRGGKGLEIDWRGRCDWCQPFSFFRWDDLFWAVRRRLELAGLGMVAIASSTKRDCGQVILLALVCRHPVAKQRWKRGPSSRNFRAASAVFEEPLDIAAAPPETATA